MSWAEPARREHDRRGLRCASDCTDAEWAVTAPLLARRTRVGRPRLHRARDLWNAIQFLAARGCQWAQLPRDFPPFTTAQYHFYRMRQRPARRDQRRARGLQEVRGEPGGRADRPHHRQSAGQDHRGGQTARR